jgi:serine protease
MAPAQDSGAELECERDTLLWEDEMITPDPGDAQLFRSGPYFTGSVIVRLRSELSAMRSDDLLHASALSVAPHLANRLAELGVKSARRLVSVVELDQLLELERLAEGSPLPPQHSLASYWRIDMTSHSEDLRQIVGALVKVPEVDDAYLDIQVVPAAVNSAGGPFSTSQGYLRPAPEGIDADWAWTHVGGNGAGVGFADVEEGWNVNHEDLAASNPSLIAGINRSLDLGSPPYSPLIVADPNFLSWNHGTGALGIVSACDHGAGIVGIAPGTGPLRLASVWDGQSPGHVVDALVKLITVLSAGDIVMLELETARGNITGWPDNYPIEIKDAERDAIRLAVSAHNLVVVAAAGNGGADLDNYISPQGASAGKNVLNRNSADFQDSGSIMVASATATVPHQRMDTMDNQSNFGSRIDCFGWGENVATCGAPLIPDTDTNANQWYRTDFNATSAATPIVAGAAAILQGINKARNGTAIGGLQMRTLLSDPAYGTAPAPSITAAKIGVMPDLRKLVAASAFARR